MQPEDVKIADAWLTEPPLDEYKEQLDINNDAVIDNKDLDLLTSEWLK